MKTKRIDKVTLLAIAKGITAVWLSLASLGLTACAGGANPSSARDEKLLVAASIAPLADFARQVGGDHVGVITLVPPGASPHTFEPTPSQVAQMARARVLALNGVGLEYWAGRLIEGLNGRAGKTIAHPKVLIPEKESEKRRKKEYFEVLGRQVDRGR